MIEPDQQRLSEVSALRARYWMAGVRRRLRPTSLDDLARLVEPELQWRNKFTGEPYRPNKWRAYDKGERSPRLSLVEKVDSIRLPGASGAGSKAEFDHVLWDILGGRPATPQTCRRWMQGLRADIQAIASNAPVLVAGRTASYGIPKLRQLEYERLRYRPGLDTLALLTLVVQQAHRFGFSSLAHEAGRWLVSALWHLSLRLDDRELLFPFMACFESWVMPMTQQGAVHVSIGDNIAERARFLRFAVESRMLRGAGCVDEAAADKEIRRIIGGKLGFGLLRLYMARPVLAPGCAASEDERRAYDWLQSQADQGSLSIAAIAALIRSRRDALALSKRSIV